MKKVRIALDWTPNVNHIGFFVAQEKGLYKKCGIEVEISSPAEDNYATTPTKKVELGEVDFALCPMESIVSYRKKQNPFLLKAVAAIFQKDLSAIATLKKSGISSPKELDGKVYASYKARYEDEIVKQMIKNDGGNGTIRISYPDKLGIWETLLKGNADATWIFLNWEGIEAENKGISLNLFSMNDYHIPYSYSPVIATSEESINHRFDTCKSFIKGTKEGFIDSMKDPRSAIDILKSIVSERDREINLREALTLSHKYMGGVEDWGFMEENNISKYVQWLKEKRLEESFSEKELFTNELIN